MSKKVLKHMPKTILITGVAGGIGRATMTLVAEKGWRVIGVDRNPFDGDFHFRPTLSSLTGSTPTSASLRFARVQAT